LGKDKVIKEMVDKRNIEKDKVVKALDLIDQAEGKNYDELISEYEKNVGTTKIGKEGLDELAEIRKYLIASGVDEKLYKFDPTIARGLASYTGPVWEYEVKDGDVGSIGGCGRYDNVISKYIGKDVPATGGSFGIERICDILKERKMVSFSELTANVMVTVFNEDTIQESLKIANGLRNAGIYVMLYPDPDKLGKQFKYADSKGIEWVVVVGPEEIKKDVVQLKNMKTEKQEEMKVDEVVKKLTV